MADGVIGMERRQFDFFGTTTDVVDDLRSGIAGGKICGNRNDHADVRELAFEQTPGEDVAGREGFGEGVAGSW